MTQADLVRLYFAKGDVYNSWNYCFNGARMTDTMVTNDRHSRAHLPNASGKAGQNHRQS